MRTFTLFFLSFLILDICYGQDTTITYNGDTKQKTTYIEWAGNTKSATKLIHHQNNAVGLLRIENSKKEIITTGLYYDNGQKFIENPLLEKGTKGTIKYNYPNGEILASGKIKPTKPKPNIDPIAYSKWKFYTPEGEMIEKVKINIFKNNKTDPEFKTEEAEKLFNIINLDANELPVYDYKAPYPLKLDPKNYNGPAEINKINRYHISGLIQQSIVRISGDNIDTIKVNPADSYTSLGQNEIIEISKNHLIIYGFNGKFDYGFQIIESKDGGKTWKYLDFPNEMDDPVQWGPLKFHNRTKLSLEFSGEKKEIKIYNDRYYTTSTDGGVTWKGIEKINNKED